jgi:hypothetical protein
MHIHPPKPLHGWKEFLNEIFVIVVGVLIALGFEAVVESLHWREQLADARETTHGEVAYNLGAMQLLIGDTACREANIGELQRRVAANDVAGVRDLANRLPQLSANGPLMTTSAWDLVKDSGLLAHVPPSEKLTIAHAYTIFDIETRYRRTYSDLMADAVGKASVFEGNPDSRMRLLEQLAVAHRFGSRTDFYPGMIALISKQTGVAAAKADYLRQRTSFPIRPCTRFDQIAKAG